MADTPTPAQVLREDAKRLAGEYSDSNRRFIGPDSLLWTQFTDCLDKLAALAEQAPVAVEAVQQPDDVLIRAMDGSDNTWTRAEVIGLAESLEGIASAAVMDGVKMSKARAAADRTWCRNHATFAALALRALATRAAPAPAAPTVAPAEPGRTLPAAMQFLIERSGGVRALSRATGLDASYISRLGSGEKDAPSDETLSVLGLERATLYRLAEPLKPGVEAGPALNTLKRIDSPPGKPDLHQWTGFEWVPVGWSVEAMAQRDKALEFAEYLAKGAEQFIAAVNLLDAEKMKRDEYDDDPPGLEPEFDAAVDRQQEAVSDFRRGLECDIYEFRKRAARAGKGEA